MLKISDLLIAHQELECFDDLASLVTAMAIRGERFFRMDVKPSFPDTPPDWEDRLEAAFSGLAR